MRSPRPQYLDSLQLSRQRRCSQSFYPPSSPCGLWANFRLHDKFPVRRPSPFCTIDTSMLTIFPGDIALIARTVLQLSSYTGSATLHFPHLYGFLQQNPTSSYHATPPGQLVPYSLPLLVQCPLYPRGFINQGLRFRHLPLSWTYDLRL
jgi:hypothetical protein